MSRLKHVRVIAPLTVFLVILTVVATVGSGVVHAASFVTVSGPSPCASCSNPGEPGTVSVNAEVEPYVAANPHTAGNIIGVWQQDRWNNGGALASHSTAARAGARPPFLSALAPPMPSWTRSPGHRTTEPRIPGSPSGLMGLHTPSACWQPTTRLAVTTTLASRPSPRAMAAKLGATSA